jgi:hypothetical protein
LVPATTSQAERLGVVEVYAAKASEFFGIGKVSEPGARQGRRKRGVQTYTSGAMRGQSLENNPRAQVQWLVLQNKYQSTIRGTTRAGKGRKGYGSTGCAAEMASLPSCLLV